MRLVSGIMLTPKCVSSLTGSSVKLRLSFAVSTVIKLRSHTAQLICSSVNYTTLVL
jgi:hypothetical protein